MRFLNFRKLPTKLRFTVKMKSQRSKNSRYRKHSFNELWTVYRRFPLPIYFDRAGKKYLFLAISYNSIWYTSAPQVVPISKWRYKVPNKISLSTNSKRILESTLYQSSLKKSGTTSISKLHQTSTPRWANAYRIALSSSHILATNSKWQFFVRCDILSCISKHQK